jgi:hypothetical protein
MRKFIYWLKWVFAVSVGLFIFVFDAPVNGGTVLFSAYLAWSVAPIRHPCDYNSYRAWRADYKNWFKQ